MVKYRCSYRDYLKHQMGSIKTLIILYTTLIFVFNLLLRDLYSYILCSYLFSKPVQ